MTAPYALRLAPCAFIKGHIMNPENISNTIKDILNERTSKPTSEKHSHKSHASVLIPLFKDDGRYKVLFTERSRKVEHHKGQISFPGGRVDDEDDTFEDAALREAHEEVGLATKDVAILGQVDDAYTNSSNFIVHPYVGLIPHPYHFKINEGEVERIVSVPLDIFFSDDANHKSDSVKIKGNVYPGTAYHFEGHIIWGATARMMENFIDIIDNKISFLSANFYRHHR